jgi:sporulation protein YlmC with PRC-barrel domain
MEGRRPMLRSVSELIGYTVKAIDGDAGSVADFHFDDREWTIRYLVVETGSSFQGRRVLVSTVALGHPEWEAQAFPAVLTKEQLESSPPVDTQKPVSRQMEEELHAYYGWSPYWKEARALAAVRVIDQAMAEGTVEALAIHSLQEVLDYDIQAKDGAIGRLDDVIADVDAWKIRYLVVDTGGWLVGRRVLVAPTWVDMVAWPEKNVHVGLTRDVVRDSPEFDPSAPVSAEYELRLYDYYGRPYDVT